MAKITNQQEYQEFVLQEVAPFVKKLKAEGVSFIISLSLGSPEKTKPNGLVSFNSVHTYGDTLSLALCFGGVLRIDDSPKLFETFKLMDEHAEYTESADEVSLDMSDKK